MKIVRLIIAWGLTVGLVWAGSTKFAQTPPLGRLLNPFSGVWKNAEPVDRVPFADARLDGLDAPVTIDLDSLLIPHIRAESTRDLYFAQGYVEASLRLWQMDFQVLAAEGRISEVLGDVLGDAAIDFDRMQRRKGMTFGAYNKLKAIEQDEEAFELLQAYSSGVNAYIAQLERADYPIEYKILDDAPEPWSVYRTALFLMNMSNELTDMEYDIEHSNFIDRFGQSLFGKLYPEWFDAYDPVIPTPPGGWSFDETALDPTDTTAIATLDHPAGSRPDRTIGSNNWALSGTRTASGMPLLANDPHLRLTLPSIWLQVHLSAPGYNAAGVSFAGTPGVIIGCNDSVAWGVTNAGRDVKDWYAIEFRDASRSEYRWGDDWRETTSVVERIDVRGGETVYDTVIYTHLGPVTYDRSFRQPDGADGLALRWRAHDGGMEFRTFYELNTAYSVEDYLAALEHYECPAQNFVFATVNGDIALRQQGRFAVLREGQGKTIQDGTDPLNEWTAAIPFDHIPMQVNPARGFVSSANQQAVDTTYPYYTTGKFEAYRNRRINRTLRALNAATVQDMIDLQFDNYDLQAAEMLPLLLRSIDPGDLDGFAVEAYHMLDTWDFFTDSNDVAPSIYEAFYDAYEHLLWDEIKDAEAAMRTPDEYVTYRLLADSIDHPFIDNQRTDAEEDHDDIVRMAFDHTVDSLREVDDLRWASRKNTIVRHVARIDAFSRFVTTGGNRSVVNATSRYHGPSWRMIVDFSGGRVQGLGVYPGGQSGNPGSPHYDQLIDDWTQRRYHPIELSTDAEALADRMHRFTLQPAP